MRVLLFDIDGTLLSAGGAGRVALRKAVQTAFGHPAPNCQLQFAGRTDAELLRKLLLQNQLPTTNANLQRLIRHYLRHLPGVLSACPGTLLPGVVALLEELADAEGVMIGCMTGNLAAAAQIKLTHFGLWESFFACGMLFGGDECHHREQLAETALRELVARFADRPFDVWIIGDTPRDIECARAIGARVLACSTGEHSGEVLAAYDPDHLIDDFSRTADVVRLLVPGCL